MMADERLKKLEQQRAKIEQQIRRQKAKLRDEERKKETRRKIILGGLIEKHCALHEDSAFTREVKRLVAEYVTGDRERGLFGLPPLPPAQNDTLSPEKQEQAQDGSTTLE